MIILAIIAVIIIMILISQNMHLSGKSNPPFEEKNIRPVSSPKYRIDDCVSNEDVQYKLEEINAQIIHTIEANKVEIQQAVKSSNGRIQARWLSSYKRVLEVSSNLDANIRAHAKNNLQSSKFSYYAGLHFRSMCAANIAYAEFESIDKTFREINQLLLDIKNRNIRVSIAEKKQYYFVKDEIKELRQVYLAKVHELNRNTGQLRDKIGAECGQRGREWRIARMRH